MLTFFLFGLPDYNFFIYEPNWMQFGMLIQNGKNDILFVVFFPLRRIKTNYVKKTDGETPSLYPQFVGELQLRSKLRDKNEKGYIFIIRGHRILKFKYVVYIYVPFDILTAHLIQRTN